MATNDTKYIKVTTESGFGSDTGLGDAAGYFTIPFNTDITVGVTATPINRIGMLVDFKFTAVGTGSSQGKIYGLIAAEYDQTAWKTSVIDNQRPYGQITYLSDVVIYAPTLKNSGMSVRVNYDLIGTSTNVDYIWTADIITTFVE